MRFLSFTVVAACMAARLCATEYYIDYAGGADTNRGTSATSAWKHCPGDPAASSYAAAAYLLPGDVVFFKGGVDYVLTGGTGISLRWDGTAGAAITYDGNSSGGWGLGRARITSADGLTDLAAFTAEGLRRNLRFSHFEFTSIGGGKIKPPDVGVAASPNFGAGLVFDSGLEGVTVERCVFRQLGYWFNARPMGTASIAGAGISTGNSSNLRVTDCEFSRVAKGIDVSQAATLNNVTITNCRFGDAVLWPIDLPPFSGAAGALTVYDCDVAPDETFEPGMWTGYGESPKTAVKVVDADTAVTWTVSAIGTPAPTFQWYKNGGVIPGATMATLRFDRVSEDDAGTYTALATNSAGASVSNRAVLVVNPSVRPSPGGGRVSPVISRIAPSFTVHPASTIASALETVMLTAEASGTPVPTLQWYRDGLLLNGATGDTLQLPAVTVNDAGTYTVVATNSAGTATSNAATVTVITPPPAPPPDPIVPSPPAPPPSPDPVSPQPPSTPPVTETTTPATATPPPSPVTPESPEAFGTPVLYAADMPLVGSAPATLDFVVPGDVPRRVLIRAVGPTLQKSGIYTALMDPQVAVFQYGEKRMENDNWGGTDILRNAMSGVAVFPIADGGSADAAVVLTLLPGPVSVVVSGTAGGTGVVWVDAYLFP